MNVKKDVLGMYVGENESAKFWLSIMNGLKIHSQLKVYFEERQAETVKNGACP